MAGIQRAVDQVVSGTDGAIDLSRRGPARDVLALWSLVGAIGSVLRSGQFQGERAGLQGAGRLTVDVDVIGDCC
jgi:hypothetical protein